MKIQTKLLITKLLFACCLTVNFASSTPRGPEFELSSLEDNLSFLRRSSFLSVKCDNLTQGTASYRGTPLEAGNPEKVEAFKAIEACGMPIPNPGDEINISVEYQLDRLQTHVAYFSNLDPLLIKCINLDTNDELILRGSKANFANCEGLNAGIGEIVRIQFRGVYTEPTEAYCPCFPKIERALQYGGLGNPYENTAQMTASGGNIAGNVHFSGYVSYNPTPGFPRLCIMNASVDNSPNQVIDSWTSRNLSVEEAEACRQVIMGQYSW